MSDGMNPQEPTDGPEGAEQTTTEGAAAATPTPTWVWWAVGGGIAVIVGIVIYLMSTAGDDPVADPSATASPSVTASPSASPSVTPSASPTPEPSETETSEPEPSETSEPEPTDTDEPEPEPTDTAAPAPPSEFGGGKIVVGKDAAAGTYRVTAAVSQACAWVLKPADASRPIRGLIEDVVVGGIPTVTLATGDTFTSSRCGTWSAVDAGALFANADAEVTVSPGVWLVGEDIQPGTYSTADLGSTSDPSKLCKWTVAESLGDNYTTTILRDVIFSGSGRVALEEGQQFESTNCGSWTKLDK